MCEAAPLSSLPYRYLGMGAEFLAGSRGAIVRRRTWRQEMTGQQIYLALIVGMFGAFMVSLLAASVWSRSNKD